MLGIKEKIEIILKALVVKIEFDNFLQANDNPGFRAGRQHTRVNDIYWPGKSV